jgi:TonB family protein
LSPRFAAISSVLALALACGVSPAGAAPPKARWEQIGEWTLAPIGRGHCALFRKAGDVTLNLSALAGGEGVLSLRDFGGSTAGGKRYFTVDGKALPIGSGELVQGPSSHSVPVGEKALDAVAAGKRLELRAASGAIVMEMDLAGAPAAVARLRTCLTEDHPEYQAVGPPAPPPPPPGSQKARKAIPVLPPYSLISFADYPPAALRASEEGVVTFRLAIDRSGKVTGCTIAVSSGSPTLDSATCDLMRTRIRFRPARDAKGKPAPDTYTARVRWSIDAAQPKPAGTH